MKPDAGPILLYDGLCGLCDGVVQFSLARDRRGVLRFAALQGAFGQDIVARHPELRDIDSLMLVEEIGSAHERVWTRSEGALRLAHYIGGIWGAIARLLRIVPRVIRDAAYDGIARIRYPVFGRYDVCRLPSAEQRGRFILDEVAESARRP